MKDNLKLLDVVAITVDIPEQGIFRGNVGTIVELLALGVFEVEFVDNEGRTYAELPLRAAQLMLLRHEPATAA